MKDFEKELATKDFVFTLVFLFVVSASLFVGAYSLLSVPSCFVNAVTDDAVFVVDQATFVDFCGSRQEFFVFCRSVGGSPYADSQRMTCDVDMVERVLLVGLQN